MNRRSFCRQLAAVAATLPIGACARAVDVPFEDLASSLEGVLVRPGDDIYDFARRTASFNPRFDRRPQAIAGVRSETDIARVIEFARRHELPLAVRSGGHDVLAESVCDGGVVIDTRYLTATSIDEATGLMRIGSGSLAGAVNAVAGRSHRAVALGCNGQVGVSGLTLGGGIGWFAGNRGATCDQVESVRVVTADGALLRVDASSEPDLFWALRGGGGNFGVVSEWSMRSFRQHEVVCGGIIFPGEITAEFLAFYRNFVSTAPDELTVEVLGNAYRRPMIAAAICYSGDLDQANDVLRPLREFATPLADGIGVRPYAELEAVPENVAEYLAWPGVAVDGEDIEPGSYWQGVTVAALTDDVIASIDEAISEAPPGWSFGMGHVMRGALTMVGAADSPLPRPHGAVTLHFDAGWSHRSQADRAMSWVDYAAAGLQEHANGVPGYVNYLSSGANDDVRRAYGANYERLAKIKARFDPDNVFSGNRNILPQS